MDTTTVLEIIKMIDVHKDAAHARLDKQREENNEYKPYDVGVFDTLSMISDHLQSFIEGQLNAAENSTGE